MRDLPLNALRAFAAVYDSGGVRPAARALQVTHSSVSRHLRELEAWIGLPLLQERKGTRSLAFTPQGEALGRTSLASLRELEHTIASLRESRRGNAVTVSTAPSFAARWLLPRLPDLQRSHPWIEVSVLADQSLVDPSDAGADLALRMGRGPWPGLQCQPFMDDALFPVMNPDYWRSRGQPRRPEALKGLALLHDRDPQASWEVWRARYTLAGLDVRPGPRFSSSDLVLRAAAQGLGVALARGRLAAEDLANGTLIRPFGELQVALPRAYWIVRSESEPLSAAAATVVTWLQDQARVGRAPLVVPDDS